MAVAASAEVISGRLATLVERSRSLEAEGLPFPTDQVRDAVELALAEGDNDRAQSILKQAEALFTKASRDWIWVRELLSRADELKATAERVGMDLAPLEARVGRPRDQLRSSQLSAGSLERAAASASLALAILNDALPKYCVQEAQKLGESIRRARDRGEEVGTATEEFRRLLRAIQEEQLPIVAQRLGEARRAVARIPAAPAVGALPTDEEEEILREARNLARRLHRIKGKAQNAQSAARLATQVRAALSEDRRFGSPEDEIEQLWSEVDRLTRERAAALGTPATGADEGAAAGPPSVPVPAPAASSAVAAEETSPSTAAASPPAETPPEPSPTTRRRRRESPPAATPPSS